MFVDLRAAFDSMNRGVVIRSMRKRGIKEGEGGKGGGNVERDKE